MKQHQKQPALAFTVLLLFLASLQVAYAATSKTNDTANWLTSHAIKKSAADKTEAKLFWYDAASLLTIEGHPFEDSLTSYSRLAPRHKSEVTKGVWNNGKSAAGVTVRFVTDSPVISVEWDSTRPAMNHMAWTGSGGVDLYARNNDGKWKFIEVGRPDYTTGSVEMLLNEKGIQTTSSTEYLMFLPLYSPVNYVRIGITEESRIAPGPPRYADKLPIIFYGTSITQGGCTSRAGMSHVGILRRRLDWPVINFGFSGSGKCEPAVADILAEIPASIYVIETVPNMSPDTIRRRVVPFVKRLRELRPDTAILMVESPLNKHQKEHNVVWRDAYNRLKADGDDNLHYLVGTGMFTATENPTVDGTHPTDLGFYEMAKEYEPTLRALLHLNWANEPLKQ